MKKLLLLSFLLISALPLLCQQEQSRQETKKTQVYIVSGERHGVSFFPSISLPHVEYSASDTLSFRKYHSLDVIYFWLEKWAREYPDLIDLYEVGKSYEGRPIMQITLTNKKTGKDTDKPASFFEGNRHSGEITSAECILWMIQYLLGNYGKDPAISHLIDTKTFYMKPVNNPDGQNLYLHTAQSNRSTVRPYDNDNDGLLDEDSPDDLDSNGVILTMRWKDEKKGNLIPDPRDTTGRIMKRVAEGKGIYLSASEGIDNDNDGRINEGEGFFEWKPAKHPVYGDIEIGGFDPKFFSQNPPSRHLEPWIRNEGLFNIEMTKHLPELTWENIEVRKTKTYKADSADYQLKVSFRNTGKLPTALKQAYLVKIVSDDRVVLDFDTAGTSTHKLFYKVIEEQRPSQGRDSRGGYAEFDRPVQRRPVFKTVPFTEGGAVTTAIFNIRLYGREELGGTASVISTRGGILNDKKFIIR